MPTTTTTQHQDAPASQRMFLNFETPSNRASLCSAIVFLASYAVDWRSCIKEYNDITLCLGQLSRREKALISGLEKVDSEPLDHAQHIRLDRIEPKVDHLRQRSYDLNRGISVVPPPGVPVPRTVPGPPLPTAAAVPNHPLQPSGEVLPAPAPAGNGSTPTLTITITAAANTISNSPSLSGQVPSVPNTSGTDGAVTYNNSSSSKANGATAPNKSIESATGNIITTNDSQQGVDETGAKIFPCNVPITNNNVINVEDDPSKVASSLAACSSVANEDSNKDSNKATEDDAQHDVQMQVDDDNNETGLIAEPEKEKVQHNNTVPVADDEDEYPPNKKRKLNA
ncbi:hypothetical protein F4803DRAFT_576775 [Xylaria telfairii]|nr:hypothetical protein F4803DRAFT_576775 [Xylaria telfairii]